MVQSGMFRNRTSALARKACSAGLRAMQALAALLLVLLASTWIASFGGHASVGLNIPWGAMKNLQVRVEDGSLLILRDHSLGCYLSWETYSWCGLELGLQPVRWKVNVPIKWAALVLTPLSVAPVLIRFRCRRKTPSNRGFTNRMADARSRLRRTARFVTALVLRSLAVGSIAASLVLVCCLLRLMEGSATLRTVAGREYFANLAYNSLTFGWPSWGYLTVPKYQLPGIEFENYGRRQSLRIHAAIVLPMAALGMVPQYMHEFRRRRAERRRSTGLCLGCGYDLTGNVTGACPECGRHSSVSGFVNPPN